ncbi:hypothetical protein CBR_g31500 [Chara braunii]|uniref:Transcription factor CBF/NF-Y/archaeal histone domain-containing protein n=1 Tax=Chara braunii TaxID=69332 RepID=A0A388LF56_CHABU|nr:hypothetical protein CBR_g31500 [Chara braunii]|eukprot:GBG80944.1 hypothetical protein CBR_g31500 [Chara braunii]
MGADVQGQRRVQIQQWGPCYWLDESVPCCDGAFLPCLFLQARIKKIMQADDEVGKIAQATPVLISKAMELFLQDLCNRTYQITAARGAKTIGISHLKACVMSNGVYDFLRDIVSQAPDAGAEASMDDKGFAAVRRPCELQSEDSGSEKEDVKRLRTFRFSFSMLAAGETLFFAVSALFGVWFNCTSAFPSHWWVAGDELTADMILLSDQDSMAGQGRGRGRGRGRHSRSQPENGQVMVSCDGKSVGFEYRQQTANGRTSPMIDMTASHTPVNMKLRETDGGIAISQTAPRLVPALYVDTTGSGSSYCLSDPFFANEFREDSQKLVGSLPSDRLQGSGLTCGSYSDGFHLPPQRLVGSLPAGRSQSCLSDRFEQEWFKNRSDSTANWFTPSEQAMQLQTSSRMVLSAVPAERFGGRATPLNRRSTELHGASLVFDRFGDGGCSGSGEVGTRQGQVISRSVGNSVYMVNANATAANVTADANADSGRLDLSRANASGASCELASSARLKREPKDFDLNMDVDKVGLAGLDSNVVLPQFSGEIWGRSVMGHIQGLQAHQGESRGGLISSSMKMEGQRDMPVPNYNTGKWDDEEDYDNYDEDEKH